MSESLDNPVWHSLSTRQARFAEGGSRALRYQSDVSPFAAVADDSAEAVAELEALVPAEGYLLLVRPSDHPLPKTKFAVTPTEGVQMVARSVAPPPPSPFVLELGNADAAEMLALATLTKPGPFLPRTHLLGSFVGIRETGRLVAMAGERMSLPGYTEISGVCTHPDARGKGYGSLLMRLVATRISERGDTPILHAYASNQAAIRLYEQLGFELRRRMMATVLRRA